MPPLAAVAAVSILAAENDEMIPRASTEHLRSSFRAGIATMTVVPGADHNGISGSPEYRGLLRGAPLP